jgi:hypothetical protein
MTFWFQRMTGMDSDVMRQMATDAGVSWDPQPIIYRGKGISYKNGNTADAPAIQDAGQKLLGYRPVQIDAPPESGTQDPTE